MAKRKKIKRKGAVAAARAAPRKTIQSPNLKIPEYDHNVWKIRHSLWSRRTAIPTRTFRKDEPGLAVTKAPMFTFRPNTPEKIPKKYIAFQPEQRVTSCEQKRERRRRAYFGYLKSPHAGKGSSKRVSPRGDRFTVKC